MNPRPRLGDLQVEHDRFMVGRSEVERPGEAAGEAVRQAAVETEGQDSFRARNPRTAVGLGNNGKRLILAVIDGRQKPYSDGTTLREKIYREQTPLPKLLRYLQHAGSKLDDLLDTILHLG